MNILPTHRPPTHPGEMLLEEFLRPSCLAGDAFARRAGIRARQVQRVVAGRGSVTRRLAQRLSRATGMTAEFWLRLQGAYDRWSADEEARLGMGLP